MSTFRMSDIRWAEAKADQKVQTIVTLKQALSEEVKSVSVYQITNGATYVKQHLST